MVEWVVELVVVVVVVVVDVVELVVHWKLFNHLLLIILVAWPLVVVIIWSRSQSGWPFCCEGVALERV